MRDRTFENQSFRASGLRLITAAIVHWNTVYLDRAIRRAARSSRQEPHEVDCCARVEHPFGVIKRGFSFVKVRYLLAGIDPGGIADFAVSAAVTDGHPSVSWRYRGEGR